MPSGITIDTKEITNKRTNNFITISEIKQSPKNINTDINLALNLERPLNQINANELPLTEIIKITYSIFEAINHTTTTSNHYHKITDDNILILRDKTGNYIARSHELELSSPYVNDTKSTNETNSITQTSLTDLSNMLIQWCPRLINYPLLHKLKSKNPPTADVIGMALEEWKLMKMLAEYINTNINKINNPWFIVDPKIVSIIKENNYSVSIIYDLFNNKTLAAEIFIEKVMLTGEITLLVEDYLSKLTNKNKAFDLLVGCPFSEGELTALIIKSINTPNKLILDLFCKAKTQAPEFYNKMLISLKKIISDNPKNMMSLVNTKYLQLVSDLGIEFVYQQFADKQLCQMITLCNDFPIGLYNSIMQNIAAKHPEQVSEFVNFLFSYDKNPENFKNSLNTALNFLDKYIYNENKNPYDLYNEALVLINIRYRDYIANKSNESCCGWYSVFRTSHNQKNQTSLELEHLLRAPQSLFSLREYQANTSVAQKGKLGEIAKRLVR